MTEANRPAGQHLPPARRSDQLRQRSASADFHPRNRPQNVEQDQRRRCGIPSRVIGVAGGHSPAPSVPNASVLRAHTMQLPTRRRSSDDCLAGIPVGYDRPEQ
jgi:hypothetical protein